MSDFDISEKRGAEDNSALCFLVKNNFVLSLVSMKNHSIKL